MGAVNVNAMDQEVGALGREEDEEGVSCVGFREDEPLVESIVGKELGTP